MPSPTGNSSNCAGCGVRSVMAPHSQLSFGPLEGQSLSPARETAQPSDGKELSPARESSLTALLAAAIDGQGCPEKVAARSQGYEPSYWSRIKSGEKPAHLDRVAGLPESVQREFVKRWGRQLRMDVRDEDAQKAALAEVAEAALRALKVIA